MQLLFHGPFPPQRQENVPGTITPKKAQEGQPQPQASDDYEPLCLLQAWTEDRDGTTAYLFFLYDLQAPAPEIAKHIARYFRITPTSTGKGPYEFIEVTPPNGELLRPVFSKLNFKWEWQKEGWFHRGANWQWRSSGYGVVLPYSESELIPEEEARYTQQLTSLLVEAEQKQAAELAPPQAQRFFLPMFAHSSNNVSNGGGTTKQQQLVLPEKGEGQVITNA
jgi:hypothetical protein